jgi:hypothetical protein
MSPVDDTASLWGALMTREDRDLEGGRFAAPVWHWPGTSRAASS